MFVSVLVSVFVSTAAILYLSSMILWNATLASAATAVVASGPIALWFFMVAMAVTAPATSGITTSVTRHLANVADAHAAGEQCDRQEEADNEDRNSH